MKEIRVELAERSYGISIGSGILERIGEKFRKYEFSPKTALVSNPTVFGLYGEAVVNSLRSEGYDVSTILIPDGEEYKDFLWAYHILSELLKVGLDRKSAILALGGGVIGDITGFAASTYMRGIAYMQLPTTLLAQVDSSVGGKTGVNHYLGKNMIGTFYQPRLVWIDVDTLKTLPKREFLAGMAEVIKYGVIWDGEFFNYLRTNRERILALDPECLAYIIGCSCEIKADVVSRDEREEGLRAILNYGHTIGHAIETVTGYRRYLHGEAVAIGMVYEAGLSESLGFLEKGKAAEIKALIDSYGLPVSTDTTLDPAPMLAAMAIDKKTVAGRLRFVLPEDIGRVRIETGVEADVIKDVIERKF
ncbi:3-dehydroquinate synthase [hydrothermal vent metagenome]|uniref:3-dehydroquinate synthase n=1 Tax=hydrothermal vent metagenome TaxID=652676 RepID=A0A3B1D1B4_9ZZZZ